jgi:hypothetical protein
LWTATSTFPVPSLTPDLSDRLQARLRYFPFGLDATTLLVCEDDGRRGAPRRGLSLLGWTDPSDLAIGRTGDGGGAPAAFTRLLTSLSLRTPTRDQHLFDNSPELFAVFHALRSLLTPRHPPCALSSLVHINPTFFRCTPSRNKSRNVPRLKTRIVRGFRTTDPVRALQAKHAAEKE